MLLNKIIKLHTYVMFFLVNCHVYYHDVVRLPLVYHTYLNNIIGN